MYIFCLCLIDIKIPLVIQGFLINLIFLPEAVLSGTCLFTHLLKVSMKILNL